MGSMLDNEQCGKKFYFVSNLDNLVLCNKEFDEGLVIEFEQKKCNIEIIGVETHLKTAQCEDKLSFSGSSFAPSS
jgi:hypothetical protein